MSKQSVETYFDEELLYWGVSVDGVVDKSSLICYSEAEAAKVARDRYPESDVKFYRNPQHSKHAEITELNQKLSPFANMPWFNRQNTTP